MIEQALAFVDASDRETWVRMAFAVKSALGDEGFTLWDEWSQNDSTYKARDAKAVWKSAKAHGGITVATLYSEARKAGYKGDETKPSPRPRDYAKERAERLAEQERREAAASKALDMIEAAEFLTHPYLASKGFPDHAGFVLGGKLLIPMRDHATRRLNSIQTIDANGKKMFLPGGRAKGSVFALGTDHETYLCEGYATALSVKAALTALYRKARVVVCFSAANIAHVAKSMGHFVVADHDANGTGQRYAEQSNLPWWMPPELGDANDYFLQHGAQSLGKELNQLRSQF